MVDAGRRGSGAAMSGANLPAVFRAGIQSVPRGRPVAGPIRTDRCVNFLFRRGTNRCARIGELLDFLRCSFRIIQCRRDTAYQ